MPRRKYLRKYLILTFVFLALAFLLPFTPYIYPSDSPYYRLVPVIFFSGLAIFTAFRSRRPESEDNPKDSEEKVVWLDEEPENEPEPKETIEFVELDEKPEKGT